MKTHYDLSDAQFEQAFQEATLAPQLFSHEAHLRLAWIHIKNYGIDDAITNITAQIKNYTHVLKAEDKYNETVTVAAIRAVYHFMLKKEFEHFEDFIAAFPRLRTNFKDLLATHYGFDIFTEAQAKSSFIQPDLLPFD
ncbi:MAG: hypothetical protein AAF489_11340 [Bacteroidota bacterium]